MEKHITIVLICLFLSIWAAAKPARFVSKTVVQPDGSTFTLIRYGDEFNKVRMTSDGCAVAQGEDLWWNYIVMDSDGSRIDSGIHVGEKVPSEVLSSSRIAAKNSESPRRASFERCQSRQEPIISRIRARGLTKADKGTVSLHGIVILAEYSDVKFSYTKADFQAMLTEKGYSRGGATGSAKDYFESQFGASYDFNFDVSDIITLKRTQEYYGGNDGNGNDLRPAEMIADACKIASDKGLDFSIYDQDGDGEVDNVFVIFAGGDEADYIEGNDNCIWSHAWYIRDGAGIDLTLSGKVINRYACCSELTAVDDKEVMTGIGTFCHEYSHTLGLPDMYDTDYERSGGYSSSLWISTSLMDGGNANNNSNTPPYFNAIDREILGMTEPETITANGIYTLSPIGNGGKVYRLDTDHPDEYYLLECRMNSGWDKYIGGSGLLIYHIDKSRDRTIFSETYRSISPRLRWDYYNEVNCNPSHPCADLIEAGSLKDSFEDINQYYAYFRTISTSSLFFPRAGTTSISAVTTPAMTWWSGTSCPYTIYDIKRSGEDIVFRVSGFEGGSLPTVQNLEKYVFQSSVHICFSTDLPELVSKATVTCSAANGTEAEEYQIHMRDSNYFYLTIENLLPSTSYNLSITLDSEYGATPADVSTFMTSSYQEGTYPYINLKASQRNEDGTFVPNQSFPLNVTNAIGASVRWSFDGKDLPLDKKGLFLLQKDGTLKAVVESPDGGKRIIVKQIKLGLRNE